LPQSPRPGIARKKAEKLVGLASLPKFKAKEAEHPRNVKFLGKIFYI
jgi:hypothetical protein